MSRVTLTLTLTQQISQLFSDYDEAANFASIAKTMSVYCEISGETVKAPLAFEVDDQVLHADEWRMTLDPGPVEGPL